jgi:DNA repair exonuclease SbcCD ATPase subunit
VPTLPGLYAIQGANLLHPDMGANGTGKSTLIDALCWAFYGRTVCGLKGPQIRSWIEDEPTVVAVDFEVRGEFYSLTRTQDPNSLNLSTAKGAPQVVDQARVDDLVGMSLDQFLAIVVLSAWGKPFLDLGATDRLNALSRVLHLDEWEARAKKAKDLSLACENRARDIDFACTRICSEIDTREDTLAHASSLAIAWERDHEAKMGKLGRLVAAATKDLESVAATLKSIEKRYMEDLEEAKRMASELPSYANRVKNAEGDLEQAKDAHKALSRSVKALDQDIERIRDMEDQSCPCCLQAVGRRHAARMVDALGQDKINLEARENKALGRVQEAQHLLTTLRSRFALMEKGHLAKAESCRSIDAERKMTISKIEIVQERVRGQQLELSQLRSSTCPHSKIVEDQESAILYAKGELTRLDSVLKSERQSLAAHQALAKLFRDLRLSVCEEAMHSFSASMSSTLEQLGLSGWRVEASLDRPTKKGDSVRGFQLLIQSPSAPEWVPWESWSGGERQRLLLAGSVAFSDIACARLGVQPSIEVWDEPTNHLSAEGVDDLADFLKSRSSLTGRTVLFIDHKTVDFGVFDGSFTVEMDSQGSTIR